MKTKHSFLTAPEARLSMATDKSIASFMLPGFSKQDLFYHMNKRSSYLDNLKKAVDNFKAKQTLVDARAENIKRQNMLNYQSEYDRIISALNHSAYRGLDRDMLKRRRNELQRLGVNAVRVNPLE